MKKKCKTEFEKRFSEKQPAAALICSVLSILITALFLVSCGGTGGDRGRNGNVGSYITAVSREEGSGTRSAFTSIFGIEEKDAGGRRLDATSDFSEVTNSTSVMITTVKLNKNALGYISLGTVNDDVKAVTVDGVSPSAENIENGRYGAARAFAIVTMQSSTHSALETDFINFIMSDAGQQIIENKGYVRAAGNEEGAAAKEEVTDARDAGENRPKGRISISGSSSVAPVMEALKEAYIGLNPDAEIELQQSDSTQGITAVREGICDIGMTSRALTESEIGEGLAALEIARDGIVIIVNKDNPIENLTSEEIRGIYMGTIKNWDEIV